MAITVSGTNPTLVTVGSNTTTTNTTFNANAPLDRNYVFDDAIDGAINLNTLVTGFGLRLQSTSAGKSVSLINNGLVAVDVGLPAVQLVAEGGAITYAGSGSISNGGTGGGLSILNQGLGAVTATISNNILGGDGRGVGIQAAAGTVSVTQTAGSVISTNPGTALPGLGISTTTGNIYASLSGTIIGDANGFGVSSTLGNVTVDFNGALFGTSGNGIGMTTGGSISINSSGNITASNNAIGLTTTGASALVVNITGGQLTASNAGVSVNANGTGGALVNMIGGQIGENGNRPSLGILATGNGTAGNVTVIADDIFATTYGVFAQITNGASTGSLSVTANGTIVSASVGIGVFNNGLNNTNVIVNGSVTGATGIFDFGLDTAVTNNGSIIGTGGIAVSLGNGNDVYNGGGTLSGSVNGDAGNDKFVSGNVDETFNGGANIDVVDYSASSSAVTVSLEAGTATGHGSDTLIGIENITGSNQADSLTGDAGANVINGGAGNDLMAGGLDNDAYFVDSVGDVVVENADSGTDTVLSSVSYVLGSTLENLTLLDGAGAINGTGNAGNNTIIGNSSSNVLNGGFGNDILTGGLGVDADFFVFDTALDAGGNVDTVTDFNDANDTFRLDDAIFTALSSGTLGANQFEIGATADEAADRIIYNQATGELFYDADGDLGGFTQIQFAQVTPGISLSNSDFIVA
ncbi:calcium-binding protein [Bradyrhizobium sp. AUGA SZCCT0240]|uniref:beta strand repeat-containing protein n=1 Tax=Bradyrhizobium sp. AUGA SZCCT0240 TaxID=2807669 RepID=UPI001BAB15DD|nr:calcium-binding protein [Bradyrhizobium sp. AUGA SZCCT0240]MBR1257947.1 calcium-binding protein [Bradyrhizobium sp. AUGA SZCCT0240]